MAVDPRAVAQGTAMRDLIVDYVAEFWVAQGRAPEHSEIAAAIGCSAANVRHHVGLLVKEGRITKDGRGRNLRVTQ